MEDRSTVRRELKRYLTRRRQSGIDVVHRLEDTNEGVRSARQEKRHRGDLREREPEREDIRVSDRNGIHTGWADGTQAGARSIRYRHESQQPSQTSLFSDAKPEKGPDLIGCDLASLEEIVSTCTRCHLSGTRTRTVFGSGAGDAKIVFIGEAPGREEDLQGLPFVGRAGQLLTKILASVGMSRDEVYITNILKCRPPENRDPQEEEVRECGIYLQRQIELIDPVLICALGRVAGQNLLRCTASLSALRHTVHYYNDTKVIVTYHPAALLRNPNLKRAAWDDIRMVRTIYEEALGSG